jgi:hypothetical protein
MASLLFPDDPQQTQGGPQGLLALPPDPATPAGDWRDTIAPQPTQADAADATAREYRAFQARDRQRQIEQGFVDPDTGKLTDAGWKQQAQTVAGGLGPADVGMAGGGLLGLIKNYHGSPHLFPPTPKNPLGEFDLSKIGTGEGNQAFGRGMYTADLEATSRGYLPKPDEPIPISPEFKTALHNEDYLGFDTASQAIAAMRAHPDWMKRWDVSDPAPLQSAFDAHEAVRKAKSGGHMYEVNIHAEPEDFLHWDKPMSEQSPQVLAALAKIPWAEPYLKSGDKFTGAQLAPTTAEGAEQLRAAGIPGIRYLDQGSRTYSPDNPFATHNHVVFDPATLEVIRRFGIAGLIGGGAATAFGGQQDNNQ